MAGKLQHEIGKRLPFESLELEAFLNVIKTADELGRQVEDFLKGHGLSATQYNVLRILRGSEPDGLPCGAISERMITRDPDVTRLLDRLEKRGLITRCRETADRRVVRTRITEAGKALIAGIDKPLMELHLRQFRHMGVERLRELVEMMEEVREMGEKSEARSQKPE